MGPRAGARILLIVGLLAASVSYSAWIATRTVLDPGATPGLARALLATHTVQDHLEQQLLTQVNRELQLRRTDPHVVDAVRQAVRDPRVVGAFTTAVTDMHAALLGDTSRTITLDGRALTQAVYEALAPVAPELAARLVQQPPIQVQMDASQLPRLGHVRNLARTAIVLGLLVALTLIGLSLFLQHDRQAIGRLRRVAYLAITPIIVFFFLPNVLGSLVGDDNAEPVGAALHVYGVRVMTSIYVLIAVGLAFAFGAALAPKRTADDPPPPAAPPPRPTAAQPVAPTTNKPSGPQIKERLYL